MTVYEIPEPVEQPTATSKAKLIQTLLAIGDQETLNADNLQLKIEKVPYEPEPKRGSYINSDPQAPAFLEYTVAAD